MRGVALLLPLVLGFSTAASTQTRYTYATPQAQSAYGYSVGQALNDWRRLRQSGGYSFADYARFLNSNPGWWDEDRLRGAAERLMRPGENAGLVLAFYAAEKPTSGNGYALLDDAYAIAVEFTAPAPGRYEIACSEYCGSGHGHMKATLVSVAPAVVSR